MTPTFAHQRPTIGKGIIDEHTIQRAAIDDPDLQSPWDSLGGHNLDASGIVCTDLVESLSRFYLLGSCGDPEAPAGPPAQAENVGQLFKRGLNLRPFRRQGLFALDQLLFEADELAHQRGGSGQAAGLGGGEVDNRRRPRRRNVVSSMDQSLLV
jgi:hypothetical protein